MTQYDEAAKRRIRWVAMRRGLLELDIVLNKFLATQFDALTDDELAVFCQILDLPDQEFLSIVNGKSEPEDPALLPLINRLRAV
ncbi:succinate dehydrogenase assembly factor 2 [Neisseriaceae bacterium CLB008]|nr:succinate dehydrogenase assembly factor 2 [Neisseriaceae bacterium]